MSINYRTQARNGDDLPNGGNIVIYYPKDMQWWDNVRPTQVLDFETFSPGVNGACVVKYYNTTHDAFWRNYGQNPIDCVWGRYAERLISQGAAFTEIGTNAEERDKDVTWCRRVSAPKQSLPVSDIRGGSTETSNLHDTAEEAHDANTSSNNNSASERGEDNDATPAASASVFNIETMNGVATFYDIDQSANGGNDDSKLPAENADGNEQSGDGSNGYKSADDEEEEEEEEEEENGDASDKESEDGGGEEEDDAFEEESEASESDDDELSDEELLATLPPAERFNLRSSLGLYVTRVGDNIITRSRRQWPPTLADLRSMGGWVEEVLTNTTQAHINAMARSEYGESNGEWNERIMDRFELNTGRGEVG